MQEEDEDPLVDVAVDGGVEAVCGGVWVRPVRCSLQVISALRGGRSRSHESSIRGLRPEPLWGRVGTPSSLSAPWRLGGA